LIVLSTISSDDGKRAGLLAEVSEFVGLKGANEKDYREQ
jgi:hypothetical protein